MSVPEALAQAAATAKERGAVACIPRQLVSWYGSSRRGSWIVAGIRRDLKKLGIRTEPDFEAVWVDVGISIVPVIAEKTETSVKKPPVEVVPPPKQDVREASPSHRISRLKAANTRPKSVKQTDKVETAVTVMMQNDFSQLPVMNSERDVKGIVSWRSIGNRLALNKKCVTVKDCMEAHHEVRHTASMFEVIRLLTTQDCVLVRDATNLVAGIVTAADISEQFQVLSEPFILLGDIENDLRRLIERSFTIDEIRKAKDAADETRKVESSADLTFGEYVRLLENPESWSKLNLLLDGVMFVKDLQEVRKIRNNVMHFDPDGIDEHDQQRLRQFASFMERLERLTTET
jgi:predicted transcriptional regulator